MRRLGLGAALAVAAMSMANPAITLNVRATVESDTPRPTKTARRNRSASSYRHGKPIRSRGPQAPKKKHPNRNHISKRVRRKHRRAA